MKLAFLKRQNARRAAVAAAALIAAAGLVAGRERPAPQVVEPSAARAEGAAAGADIDLAKLQRGAAEAPQNDPFAPRSFTPRASAAAGTAPAPAPAKTAPPLPFTYAGWLTQDGHGEVFVARGDELISIQAGQNIEPDYRVDSITDSSIGFTYLPMKTRQVLERAEAEGGKPGSERAEPERPKKSGRKAAG